MAFDLATAKPMGQAAPVTGGFDLSTAKPVAEEKTGLAAFDDKIKGGIEAGLTMLTGATSGVAGFLGGALGGIAGSVASGKYGTQEGAAQASQTAQEGAHKLTYQPSSDAGKEALAKIGSLFEESKLGGLGPVETVALNGIAPSVRATVRQVAAPADRVIQNAAERVTTALAPAEREMSGGGSAATFEDTLRRQRASALPVPIKLTKGQAERTFEQQQFERETAKNPTAGEPLRQRFAEQNNQILQNFDAWVDQTGAEAGSLRSTGEAVSKALVQKSNKAKVDIRMAYNNAERSGAMLEEIELAPLKQYLADHKPEAINAPVLTSVESKLAQLASDGDTLSINGLEEIRKMTGRLAGKDATNAAFGRDVKEIIDQMTEGRGGDAYKQARALRFQYGKEFERQGAVAKLLANKPGTSDRSVAYEDVFNHSIMKGSLDDVRAVRKTLQTAGPEGQQAWRELQGATIKHFKDEITKNVATDINGNPVVSPAKLNSLVTALDTDGKLDFIFGKQGAQQIRDVNGISKDLFTSPPGAVNHSNTASILIGLLDTAVSGLSGAPLPIGTALNFGVKRAKNKALLKRVNDALKDPDE